VPEASPPILRRRRRSSETGHNIAELRLPEVMSITCWVNIWIEKSDVNPTYSRWWVVLRGGAAAI